MKIHLSTQKRLALTLLEWHGGQSSGLYAVGSCMLSDSDNGRAYDAANHRGHDKAIHRAIAELRELKARANFPACVTAKDEAQCNKLADRLAKFIPQPITA